MTDDKPIILKPKRKKRLRKIVMRQKAEYKGYYRHRTPSGKKDENGKPLAVFVLSWQDENGDRRQKRVHVKDDKNADENAKALRGIEIARVKEIQTKGRPETPAADTFEQFSKLFLSHQKSRISDTVAKHRITQAEFDRQEGVVNGPLMKHFGTMRLALIQQADVIDYLNQRMSTVTRRNQKMSNGTVIKERNILRKLLNVARAKKKIFVNPADKDLSDYVPEKPEGKLVYLSPEQFWRIYAFCEIAPTADDQRPMQWLQEFAALAVTTGCRRGELMAVTIPEINLVARTMELAHTKNGKAHTVHLNDDAIAVLDAMNIAGRQKRGDMRVLWPGITPENVSMRFRRAAKKAGVTGPKGEPVGVHTLRHTFASQHKLNGTDMDNIRRMLNHGDMRVTAIYAKVGNDYMAKQASRLNGVFKMPTPATIEGEVKALPADTPS